MPVVDTRGTGFEPDPAPHREKCRGMYVYMYDPSLPGGVAAMPGEQGIINQAHRVVRHSWIRRLRADGSKPDDGDDDGDDGR